MSNIDQVDLPELVVILTSTESASTGGAQTISYTAIANTMHLIGGVAWSYPGTPTGGALTITNSAAQTLFNISITTAGPGFIPFNPPITSGVDNSLVVSLTSGGVSPSPTLNVLGHWEI